MTPQDIAARIRRLHALAMGLRKEHHRSGDRGFEPVTLDERAQYAAALWEAAKALDAACIPLGSALRRLEGRAERP
jgi:hypothetical protein